MFGEDLSDTNLFRRVRRGDRRAFSVLVRRHDPGLRGLATRLLAEPKQVDPVLHRVYAKAWRTAGMARLGKNGKGDSVGNWLYRAVYNACVDELRRQPAHDGPPPPSGPRVRLPKASAERRLSALRALDASERIPLVLVDAEGFSIPAAARILQRTPTEVAADLDRARRRWRDLVIGVPPATGPGSLLELEGAGEADDVDAAEAARSDQPDQPDQTAQPSHAAPTGQPGQEQPTAGAGGASSSAGSESQPSSAGNGGTHQPAPTSRRSPDIDNPRDVVYAAEGAFDAERFDKLKQWFRSKGEDQLHEEDKRRSARTR